jgi:hypothetical protein
MGTLLCACALALVLPISTLVTMLAVVVGFGAAGDPDSPVPPVPESLLTVSGEEPAEPPHAPIRQLIRTARMARAWFVVFDDVMLLRLADFAMHDQIVIRLETHRF